MTTEGLDKIVLMFVTALASMLLSYCGVTQPAVQGEQTMCNDAVIQLVELLNECKGE